GVERLPAGRRQHHYLSPSSFFSRASTESIRPLMSVTCLCTHCTRTRRSVLLPSVSFFVWKLSDKALRTGEMNFLSFTVSHQSVFPTFCRALRHAASDATISKCISSLRPT